MRVPGYLPPGKGKDQRSLKFINDRCSMFGSVSKSRGSRAYGREYRSRVESKSRESTAKSRESIAKVESQQTSSETTKSKSFLHNI